MIRKPANLWDSCLTLRINGETYTPRPQPDGSVLLVKPDGQCYTVWPDRRCDCPNRKYASSECKHYLACVAVGLFAEKTTYARDTRTDAPHNLAGPAFGQRTGGG